jgi:hypothetical protein
MVNDAQHLAKYASAVDRIRRVLAQPGEHVDFEALARADIQALAEIQLILNSLDCELGRASQEAVRPVALTPAAMIDPGPQPGYFPPDERVSFQESLCIQLAMLGCSVAMNNGECCWALAEGAWRAVVRQEPNSRLWCVRTWDGRECRLDDPRVGEVLTALRTLGVLPVTSKKLKKPKKLKGRFARQLWEALRKAGYDVCLVVGRVRDKDRCCWVGTGVPVIASKNQQRDGRVFRSINDRDGIFVGVVTEPGVSGVVEFAQAYIKRDFDPSGE